MSQLKLPPLRALQAFDAVGRNGSLNAAASELGVTVGAISQQIHLLEETVKVPLFERRGRVLQLTKWGKLYLERIKVGFEHLHSAHEVLQRSRLKAGIAVSGLPSLTIRWLRPLISEWQVTHPGGNILLIGEDENPDLDDEQIDFRIFYGKSKHNYHHFVELFFDWAVPVCSPRFLAQHPMPTAKDILKVQHIGIEWDLQFQSPPSLADWAKQLGLPPPQRPPDLTFSLSSAAIDAALSDGGIVMGQLAMVQDELAKGSLVIPHDYRMLLNDPYVLAWNPAVLDRPLGREFKSFLIQMARRQGRDSAGPQATERMP